MLEILIETSRANPAFFEEQNFRGSTKLVWTQFYSAEFDDSLVAEISLSGSGPHEQQIA